MNSNHSNHSNNSNSIDSNSKNNSKSNTEKGMLTYQDVIVVHGNLQGWDFGL